MAVQIFLVPFHDLDLKLGSFLGEGEFGTVYEVSGLGGATRSSESAAQEGSSGNDHHHHVPETGPDLSRTAASQLVILRHQILHEATDLHRVQHFPENDFNER